MQCCQVNQAECADWASSRMLRGRSCARMASALFAPRKMPRCAELDEPLDKVAPRRRSSMGPSDVSSARSRKIADAIRVRLVGQSSRAGAESMAKGSAEDACRQFTMTRDRCESPPMPQGSPTRLPDEC